MLDYHGRAPANHHTAIEFTFEAPIVKKILTPQLEEYFMAFVFLILEIELE